MGDDIDIKGERRNAGVLLPPPPDRCQECATDHPHDMPHNPESMYYRMAFRATRGRHPTWTDAMAHCPPEVRGKWRAAIVEELRSQGRPVPDDLMGEKPAAAKGGEL